MKAKERRAAIAMLLLAEQKAITGDALSERYGVSRQIIVQDIAYLREQGYEILPTHNGYVMKKTPLVERTVKVKHTTEQTEDELSCIVACGASVADVYVWHKVYGKICVPLNIFTQAHVDQFMEGVRSGKSVELMHITGGQHYHTVRAESEEILNNVEKVLAERHYLIAEAE